jgi:hypothetical protein
MAKLNAQLVNEEIAPSNQTTVTNPYETPATPKVDKTDDVKADESIFSKNKNVIIVGVVLVLGYLLFKDKIK